MVIRPDATEEIHVDLTAMGDADAVTVYANGVTFRIYPNGMVINQTIGAEMFTPEF